MRDSTVKVSEVPTCSKKETFEKFPSIGFCLLKNDVTKAEIGWCMCTIKGRLSHNSCTELKDLFCGMFQDSEIAEGFVLDPTKASHLIWYGVVSCYKRKIMKQLTPKDMNLLMLYCVLLMPLMVFQIKNRLHLIF